MQHSQSPMKAEGGAVMAITYMLETELYSPQVHTTRIRPLRVETQRPPEPTRRPRILNMGDAADRVRGGLVCRLPRIAAA
jgi:hypothetical protein